MVDRVLMVGLIDIVDMVVDKVVMVSIKRKTERVRNL
jgi:hypothetical protein